MVPGGAGRRAGLARARPLPVPRRPRAATAPAAQQLGVGLRRPGVDAGRRHRPVVPPPLRHHPARPRLAQPRGAGDCSRTCCASGSTAASTASGSTSRTASSRRPACATRCSPRAASASSGQVNTDHSMVARDLKDEPMWDQPEVHDVYRALAPGPRRGRRRTGWPSPRPGPRRPSRWPPSSAPTSSTRPSTSPGCSPTGRPRRSPTVITGTLAAVEPVGASPDLGAVSNHDVVRHVTRYGGGASRAGPRSRGDADDAGAARLELPLPGRGARPRAGRRAAGGPAGPVLVPHRRGRPRRLPGADAVGRHASRRTPSGRATTQPWIPQPADWADLTVEAQTGRPGLDAGVLPTRAGAPAGEFAWTAGDECRAARRLGTRRARVPARRR